MYDKCLKQQQDDLARHANNYQKKLAVIKSTEAQKAFKEIHAKQEYNAMVRATERNFHMCFSGHLANNAH